jgi:hypothetical protein
MVWPSSEVSQTGKIQPHLPQFMYTIRLDGQPIGEEWDWARANDEDALACLGTSSWNRVTVVSQLLLEQSWNNLTVSATLHTLA